MDIQKSICDMPYSSTSKLTQGMDAGALSNISAAEDFGS